MDGIFIIKTKIQTLEDALNYNRLDLQTSGNFKFYCLRFELATYSK